MAPSRWCGECDCLIGPFPNSQVAGAFAGFGPSGGVYEAYRFELHADAGAVYLLATRADASTVVALPHEPHALSRGPR